MKIIWTKRAAQGYGRLLTYLDDKWTEKEVSRFERDVKSFLDKLRKHPYLLVESKTKGLRKGPINKHTILTYRVDEKRKEIQLINLRSTKQRPARAELFPKK